MLMELRLSTSPAIILFKMVQLLDSNLSPSAHH
jgi:hypothetical protein